MESNILRLARPRESQGASSLPVGGPVGVPATGGTAMAIRAVPADSRTTAGGQMGPSARPVRDPLQCEASRVAVQAELPRVSATVSA